MVQTLPSIYTQNPKSLATISIYLDNTNIYAACILNKTRNKTIYLSFVDCRCCIYGRIRIHNTLQRHSHKLYFTRNIQTLTESPRYREIGKSNLVAHVSVCRKLSLKCGILFWNDAAQPTKCSFPSNAHKTFDVYRDNDTVEAKTSREVVCITHIHTRTHKHRTSHALWFEHRQSTV